MSVPGRQLWVIPGGCIPLASTGREPEFTSRDEVALLNPGETDASLEITIYYTTSEPVGPYALTIKARRMRQVRFNDLIFPEALPLGVEYAALIRSDVPIVVQFTRYDTGRTNRALMGAVAYSIV